MEQKLVKGIEVELKTSPEVIKDNLERIGISNRSEKKLFPSCYLIKSPEGKYFICHFKDLLKIEKADSTDELRRNTIAWLLDRWGILKIVGNKEEYPIQKKKLFILTKEQKAEDSWEIIHKFHETKQKEVVK